MRITIPLAICLATIPVAASSQAHQQPYAGLETRAIKALSPEQVGAYLEGQGLGFAQAAELNHYPGPKHALELADELELSDEQRKAAQAIFEGMNANAKRLGRQLVEMEQALDSLFAGGTEDSGAVRIHVERIGSIQGALRFTHLAAHLEMKRVLTAHQIMTYDRLRGYGAGVAHEHRDGH